MCHKWYRSAEHPHAPINNVVPGIVAMVKGSLNRTEQVTVKVAVSSLITGLLGSHFRQEKIPPELKHGIMLLSLQKSQNFL